MVNKYILSILFLININIIICDDDSNYINWGINNYIVFSPSIEILKDKNNNNKKFIARDDIQRKQEILKIPNNVLFNIDKSLDMINSNELKSQYELFKNIDVTVYNLRGNINIQKEEKFLAYILYLMQHEPKLYNNTKFYQKYKLYISSLDKNIPRSPLFYTGDQIEYLSGTYLGHINDKVKKMFQEEMIIFKNGSFYNKSIEYKDYVLNRLETHNRALEISGHLNLVPFLNYFDRDHMRCNAEYVIQKNGDIKIVSNRLIKKDENIIVRFPRKTNTERFVFEGELNTNYKSYSDEYIIHAFSPGLFYKYDLEDIELYNNYFIDLVEKDFDKTAVILYKNNTKIFKGDEGEAWAYGVLSENINFYKEYLESLNHTRIHQIFDNFDDRILIEKALKGETRLLRKASEYIQNKAEAMKEKEKAKKEKKNKKDNKNYDL
jgi:hypothetical protein